MVEKKFTILPRRMDNVVQTPSSLTGEFAEEAYREYRERVKRQFRGNQFFQLQLVDGEIVGSTLQDALLMDEILREKYGARVLLPSDSHKDMRVPNMIKDKHYVDRSALVLRGPEAKLYDARGRNIAELLEARDEIDVERLEEEPALVTGLKVVPACEDYGFVFEPTGEFKVVYSDKFHKSYHNKKFNGFDENGVPMNFAEDGIFRNYTGDEPPRVSRFGLDGGWLSYSIWYRFDGFFSYGRVVVADAVGVPKISDVLAQSRKSELLERLAGVREYLISIEADLQ